MDDLKNWERVQWELELEATTGDHARPRATIRDLLAVAIKYPNADDPIASTSHVPNSGPSTKPSDVALSDTANTASRVRT